MTGVKNCSLSCALCKGTIPKMIKSIVNGRFDASSIILKID